MSTSPLAWCFQNSQCIWIDGIRTEEEDFPVPNVSLGSFHIVQSRLSSSTSRSSSISNMAVKLLARRGKRPMIIFKTVSVALNRLRPSCRLAQPYVLAFPTLRFHEIAQCSDGKVLLRGVTDDPGGAVRPLQICRETRKAFSSSFSLVLAKTNHLLLPGHLSTLT